MAFKRSAVRSRLSPPKEKVPRYTILELFSYGGVMMDFGYPTLMFCFAGALLLYSVLLVKTGNISLIPQADKAGIQDKRAYTEQFGKAVAVISLAPAISGILWLTGGVRRSIDRKSVV